MDREEGEKEIKKSEEDEDREPEGIAGNVLKGLGDIIPGLGGLIKGLKKSAAFQDRLKVIDAEVEARLKGKGLTEKEGEIYRSRPTVATPKEVPVELFDEGDYWRVIAELPGIEEKDIKVDLEGARVLISVNSSQRKYHREINLACTPKGDLKKVYKNGILEITIEK